MDEDEGLCCIDHGLRDTWNESRYFSTIDLDCSFILALLGLRGCTANKMRSTCPATDDLPDLSFLKKRL